MKKRSVIFLMSLIFLGKLFCFELKQTPKNKMFTQFESNKDLYIIYHNAYVDEDEEIMKKAFDEGRFVLFVSMKSFDEFFYDEKKNLDYHCPFYKV